MMNSHITSFLWGMANAGASRVSTAGGSIVKCPSLNLPPPSTCHYQHVIPNRPSKGRRERDLTSRMNHHYRLEDLPHSSNSHPQQNQQVHPQQTHKMPILRCGAERVHSQHAAMHFAGYVRESDQAADHVQGMQHSENVKERTARSRSEIQTFRPQLQPGSILTKNKDAPQNERSIKSANCRCCIAHAF